MVAGSSLQVVLGLVTLLHRAAVLTVAADIDTCRFSARRRTNVCHPYTDSARLTRRTRQAAFADRCTVTAVVGIVLYVDAGPATDLVHGSMHSQAPARQVWPVPCRKRRTATGRD